MRKYRLYIDEVGNPDLKSSINPNHRFLCLTGVVVDLEHIRNVIQPEMERLKQKYFNSHPDDPIIFHRKELVQKKPPFSVLKDVAIEREFNQDLLTCFGTWDYRVISVTIDKQEHDSRYSRWKYDPYHYCQEILIERFRLFLDIKKSIGDVMIESRGAKEDTRLKKSFRNIMDNGTRNLEAVDLNNKITSKELKVRQKQNNIAGLQIADLLAHAVRRWFFINSFDLEENQLTFSDSIIEILEREKFFRYNGIIYGYGAKKLP